MVHIDIDQYIPTIKSILQDADPQVITPKDVRLQLESRYKVDLTPQKKEVQQLIEKLFDEMSFSEEEEEEEVKEESDDVKTLSPANTTDRVSNKKPKKLPQTKKQAETKSSKSRKTDVADAKKKNDLQKKKKSTKRKRKDEDDTIGSAGEARKKRITGIHKPLRLSPVMAKFLGEAELSRLEVVKRLWAYIKTNGLQDPNDKRYIICDDKLYPIFEMDRLHSFTMNKFLTPHLTKLEGHVAGENGSGIRNAGAEERLGRPLSKAALNGIDFAESSAEQPGEDKDGSEELFDIKDSDDNENSKGDLSGITSTSVYGQ